MRELSEYFTGEKALTRVARDENLMKWFEALAREVEALDDAEAHATMMGRKIATLVSALEEVEQFEQVDTNMQIKAFLADTRDFLHQMVRVVNIQHTILNTMETISDLSYAWELMNDYIIVLHQRVLREPATAVLLRSTFLKLASILDVPLIRISQCDSPDQVSVAEYYSGELVAFVRRVLDIIPVSVFRVLDQIVEIQTHRLTPLPVKFEVQNLKEYAQLDERYDLARLTHQISVFTDGVLAMEKTLLGVIQVDPRQILQDGLRRELVRQVSRALHETLAFRTPGSASELEGVSEALAARMHGFRRSVEYVQDYCDIAGLKMWQEELGRVINYNTEHECNRYLRKKVYDGQSKFQSKVVPIPRFAGPPPGHAPDAGDGAYNFVGRLLSALLAATDPTRTIYAPESCGWYTADGVEQCGIKTFSLLNRAVSVIGLAGLDRLLAFKVVHELNGFLREYRASVVQRGYLPLLEQLRDGLFPEWSLPKRANRLYGESARKLEGVMPPLLARLRAIGQAQLLRRQIALTLRFHCRLDANLLHQALAAFDTAVLNDIHEHYRAPDEHPCPKESNPLLYELTRLLDASGFNDPSAQIYIVTEPLEGLPVVLLLFIIRYVGRLQYDPHFGTLCRRKPSTGGASGQEYALDGTPLAVGLACLLRQFHPSYLRQLLAYLGQFVRATIHTHFQTSDGKAAEVPAEVSTAVLLVDALCKAAGVPRAAATRFIPAYIYDAINLPGAS